MWIAVWIVLVVALLVVPTFFAVRAVMALVRAGQAASQAAEVIEEATSDIVLSSVSTCRQPGASQDAASLCQAREVRQFIARDRAFRRHRRLASVMDRWHRLHLSGHTYASAGFRMPDRPDVPQGSGAVTQRKRAL